MRTVLVLSVGGACEPLVRAVRDFRPDYVYFLCSSGPRGSEAVVDGPGHPCGDSRSPQGRSVVEQAALPPQRYRKVAVADPDDLVECYAKVSAIAAELSSEDPPPRVVANYTGGTKTMSVALSMVATLSDGWDLSVNRGARVDLVRVASGTDVPVVLDKWALVCRIQLPSVREALRRFDYAAAARMLEAMMRRPVGRELRDRLVRAVQLCRGLDLWDRFDHAGALAVLRPVGGRVVPLGTLAKLVEPEAGYERVADLVGNAERRALQERYDDSVARLYRAVELTAQVRLERQYKIHTGDVDQARLPESLRDKHARRAGEDNKIRLGLRDAYELLDVLGDPVGRVYSARRSELLDALRRRNESIGGHGLTPISEPDYRFVRETLLHFLAAVGRAVNTSMEPAPLPGEELLEALGFR